MLDRIWRRGPEHGLQWLQDLLRQQMMENLCTLKPHRITLVLLLSIITSPCCDVAFMKGFEKKVSTQYNQYRTKIYLQVTIISQWSFSRARGRYLKYSSTLSVVYSVLPFNLWYTCACPLVPVYIFSSISVVYFLHYLFYFSSLFSFLLCALMQILISLCLLLLFFFVITFFFFLFSCYHVLLFSFFFFLVSFFSHKQLALLLFFLFPLFFFLFPFLLLLLLIPEVSSSIP